MSHEHGPDVGGRAARVIARGAVRVFAAFLFVVPRDLRRAHGREMEEVFDSRLRVAVPRGSRAVLRAAARSVGDLIVQGIAARAGRRPAPRRRERRQETGMIDVWRDVRMAVRSVRRAPLFAGAAIVTFAVAVGAVTSVYAAVEGLLLRPLPFPDPDRLVFIGESEVEDGEAFVTSRYVIDRVAAEVDGLESVSTYNIWEAILVGAGDPIRLSGAVVTEGYFRALGVSPARGRTFLPEDDVEGAPRRVVISHRLWQSRFGAEDGVVGRTIDLNGVPYEVIGVLHEGFESPDEYTFSSNVRRRPDVWRTFRVANSQMNPGGRSYRGVARLAPGASLDVVRSEIDALEERIAAEHATFADQRVQVLPLQEQFSQRARPTLMLLLAGVGFVLLAACVNVMSLSLARGLDRSDDLRVRVALGAGRGALLRQLVFEVVVLAFLGGALGVWLAALGVDAFVGAAPADLPRLNAIRIDPRTVAVAGGVTLMAALLSGALPGVRLLWGRRSLAVPGAARTRTPGAAQRRTLSGFSVAQVALALVLLTGAGLLLRSFARLVSVDPGYSPRGVATAQLDLTGSRYAEGAARAAAVREILRRVEADPAVAAAGFVTSVPQHGLNDFSFRLDVAGYDPGPDGSSAWARYRGVAGRYAEAMELTLVAGRMIAPGDWTEEDGGLNLSGVTVNEEFVRRWLPDGADPLGWALDLSGMGMGSPSVVGVARPVKYGSLDQPDDPEIYVPITGRFSTIFLAARTPGDPSLLPARLKAAVHEVDPGIPMEQVFLQEDLMASATARARTTLWLMAALSAFVLVLSAVGLYGVVAHGVTRRRREFGVRLAIGSTPGAMARLVMVQGMRLVAWGTVLGLGAAWAASRFLESMLFQVRATDAVTMGGVTFGVLLVGALSIWVPARRALTVDPVEALRGE